MWWLTWVQRNSCEALDFLEEFIAMSQRDESYALVEELCHRIHNGIEGAPISLRNDVSPLARMVPIVYDLVSIEEDISHEGVFSPGPRDNAQDVRSYLVKWLAAVPGPDSVLALRRMADDPRVASVREWLLHQADARVVADAATDVPDVEVKLIALVREYGIGARGHVSQLEQRAQTVKILFLASNPACSGRLELAEEARQIQMKLRASELRDAIFFRTEWAVQPGDLQQLLLEEAPTIVHFSGHGDDVEGLVFHDESLEGEGHLISKEALLGLLRVLKDRIRVVVLNACYSAEQASTIADTIDFVVGMSGSIGDQAAIKFAAAFYRGLGFGRSVQTSFDLGVSEMELAGHAADAAKPVLHVRGDVDATATVLVSAEGTQG